MSWNGTSGFPASLVWDATGLVNAAAAGLSFGDEILGNELYQNSILTVANLGSGTPASTNTEINSGPVTITYPLGPSGLSTTTWNTTPLNPPVGLGHSPSGVLPLVADLVVDATNGDTGLGGSPMQTSPFQDYSLNLDFNRLTVSSVSNVPLPSAVWLFATGLVGLTGLFRAGAARKRS